MKNNNPLDEVSPNAEIEASLRMSPFNAGPDAGPDHFVSTRRGMKEPSELINMTIKERAARLEEWKAAKGRRRFESRAQIGANKDANAPVIRDVKDSPGILDAAAGKPNTNREIRKLNTALLRTMLTDKDWADFSSRIKEYQDELAEIVVKLEEEGKPCTGCALKPYRAKMIKKLAEDFKDENTITPSELVKIKEALETESLQVGLRNGKPYVR
jgi:hypothetical protein